VPRPLSTCLAVALLAVLGGTARADGSAVVAALREGGVAVLLRHGRTTPGVGDPPGWKMSDCATQRNLDAEGRAQSRRVGAWFKARRLTPKAVRNSPWCRTRETARLAFGRSEDWPALANLFEDRSPAAANAEHVRRYIAGLRKGDIAVLVTHGSTISAIVGENPAQGEAIVVRAERGPDDKPRLLVIGRLTVP
jgi:phosphohistidine phosphatase SixA